MRKTGLFENQYVRHFQESFFWRLKQSSKWVVSPIETNVPKLPKLHLQFQNDPPTESSQSQPMEEYFYNDYRSETTVTHT